MKHSIWDGNDGQPPDLHRVIGLKVVRAWITRDLFAVAFEGEWILLVRAIPSTGCKALELRLAHKSSPGVTGLPPDQGDEGLRALVGRRFAGLDSNVLDFGNEGVRVTNQGFEFVYVPGAIRD